MSSNSIERPRSIFRFRRGLTSAWETKNPILADGEPGIEVILNGPERLKFGDGVTPWNDLDYAAGSGDIQAAIDAVLAAIEPSDWRQAYIDARDEG